LLTQETLKQHVPRIASAIQHSQNVDGLRLNVIDQSIDANENLPALRDSLVLKFRNKRAATRIAAKPFSRLENFSAERTSCRRAIA
jgi:hypothetical protein